MQLNEAQVDRLYADFERIGAIVTRVKNAICVGYQPSSVAEIEANGAL